MFYTSNGNIYTKAADGKVYPVDITAKEKVVEYRTLASITAKPHEETVELPEDAMPATLDEIRCRFVLSEDHPLTFDSAKHEEALKPEPEPEPEPEKQSEVVVSIKDDGSYLEVNYADLGTFQIDGLSITGTANQVTAKGWNGEGQDKTGYFIGLHFDNCKLLKTANHPEGKSPDETGDWLLSLGEESPTLSYFEVVDNADKSDRYTVSVTAAAKVSTRGRRVTAKPSK